MANDRPAALLVGASRGLGLGLAREFRARDWQVTATARSRDRAGELSALEGKVELETVDIDHAGQVAALKGRLGTRRFDLVFLIAGVAHDPKLPMHNIPPAEASRVMETNALSPIRAAETLAPLVRPGGVLAFMTSILGSVSGNTTGGWEVYRASKAALNTMARSFALRHEELAVLLLHPGWVRTDMGGSQAPLDVETSVRGLADVIERTVDHPGHAYLDWEGRAIAW